MAKPAAAQNDNISETLTHAQKGYDTAQATIQLLDTKVGIITGFSTLMSGFVLAWAKWSVETTANPFSLLDLVDYSAAHRLIFGALIIVNFAATFACILWTIWTVIARGRPKNLNERFLVLFPQYHKRDAKEACREFERKLQGMSQREILREYEDQLRVLGWILGAKLAAHSRATKALLVQVICVMFLILSAGLTWVFVGKSPPNAEKSSPEKLAPSSPTGSKISFLNTR